MKAQVPAEIRERVEGLPEGKWFAFRQNNSGGYYTPPAQSVFVYAKTARRAQAILEEQDGFTTSYCSCCGERWYDPDETDKAGVIEAVENATWGVGSWLESQTDRRENKIPPFAFLE